jgi:extradiol dioxygenase family protein
MPDNNPPIRLRGIDHLVLRCMRLSETMAFYTQVLGCSVRRIDAANQLYQLNAGPGALIDLVPVGSALGGQEPPASAQSNMAHFCVRIAAPDWPAIRSHLESHGIIWEEPRPRFGAEGRGPSVYIADPEGNQVELKAELDEDST